MEERMKLLTGLKAHVQDTHGSMVGRSGVIEQVAGLHGGGQ
jgi:hypothetical protein